MTPKNKAKQIYYKILNELLKDSELIIKKFIGLNILAISEQSGITCVHAKQCALIAVEELIKEASEVVFGVGRNNLNNKEYWLAVKEEINKL